MEEEDDFDWNALKKKFNQAKSWAKKKALKAKRKINSLKKDVESGDYGAALEGVKSGINDVKNDVSEAKDWAEDAKEDISK